MRIVLTLILGITFLGINAQQLKTRNGYVRFFSEAPLENIEAVNKQVSSVIDMGTGEFAFLVPIKGFVFEKALMQEHFNENYMESGKYPTGKFTGKVEGLEDVSLSKDGKYDVVFVGTMDIHGTKKDLKEPATFVVKDGNATLESQFYIVPEEYGVEIPASKRENIAKELEVTVKMDYDADAKS